MSNCELTVEAIHVRVNESSQAIDDLGFVRVMSAVV